MSIFRTTSSLAAVRLRVGSALATVIFLAGCSTPPSKPENPQALPECGWLPNCVNTQSGRGAQASEPIRATAEQWQELRTWIALQQDWQITVDDGNFMQAIVTTTLMKFQDDVQLLFVADEQSVHVRSSSKIGLSDLGTNARRVETLRDQVKAHEG